MAPRILLCTGLDWPFPARLARAFADLGARIEAVCPGASPLRHSAATARLHKFSLFRPLSALAAAIEKAAPDPLIPCDDLTVEMLWRLGREQPGFAPLLGRSLGKSETYSILAARSEFLAQAAAIGAPIAENLAIESEADLGPAITMLGSPLVLKSDGSWGGDGIAIVRDIKTARTACRRLSRISRARALARAFKRRKPHYLVQMRFGQTTRLSAQQFIAGHPATSAIACWQGRLLAAHHFDVAVSEGTGPASVVTRTDCAVMEAAASRLTAHFGLTGLYGLDYMRGQDGRIFLLEINPRATPTSHLALGPGRDLAAALLSAAGHPVPDRPADTHQARIALFPQELRRDPQSPHLTSGYHDLPRSDPALAKALARAAAFRSGPLTSFSQDFSVLPGFETISQPPGR